MTSELETCPVCGDGKLHPRTETSYHTVIGFKEPIPVLLEFSVCDGCESDVCDNDQVNNNAQRMRNARNGKL